MTSADLPVVLVTGAGSGIGRAAAELFARRGFRVAAVARKESDLSELAALGGNVFPFACDLSDPSRVADLCASVMERLRRVDLLVNNAGYGLRGAIEESDPDAVRALFEVNVIAPFLLARAFLPGMRERRRGTVINVSSVTGIFVSPFNGFYAATKHALEGWTDALRMEVEQFGVRVSLIQIGPVTTKFIDNAERNSRATLDNPASPYRSVYGKMIQAVASIQQNALPPEAVARLILRIAQSKRPRARYRLHFLARIAPFLLFFFPRRVLDILLQRKVGLR